jgi:hypothetical protein
MKWEAWNKLQNMTKPTAKKQYIEKVIEYFQASEKLSMAPNAWLSDFDALKQAHEKEALKVLLY